MKKVSLALALTLTCGTAQAAPGYIYECAMTYVKENRGWVSPAVAFVLPGDGSVKVVDAVTLHYNKGPLVGTIVRENDKRLIVKWTLRNASTRSGKSFNYFDYRASISKSSGAVELTAMPRHFDAGLRSPGTCRKRTG